jgi:multiple sugar transport system substrate-binding protein
MGHEDSTERVKSTLSRRRFLRTSVGGLAGLALVPLLNACGGAQPAPTAAPAKEAAKAGPGGFAGGGSLKILVRSSFVPAYDEWLDKWAQGWAAQNRVEIAVDHLLAGEVPAKMAAEVAAGGGHDLYGMTQSGMVHLYNKQLVDVTDVAKQVGDRHGGWIPFAEQLGMFEGSWKGVPDYFYDLPGLYRKDLFEANGLQPVDTWDDLLRAGTVLKEKGNPIGIAINQKTNDANNSWSGLLWSYGGSVAGADGKTVSINSPETKEALRFAVELYNKTMTNEVLSWDDSANNQGLASGRISWIQNPISALRTIEGQNKELAEKIFISNAPAGPKGRYTSVSTSVWGLMEHSKDQAAAKAFLVDYYGVYIDGFRASTGFNQPPLTDFRKKPMPILGEDPKLHILQDFNEAARTSGFPGPPTVAAAEVDSNWIIPLMVGQAVQDGNVDGAVSWAEGKIKAIYDKYK